MVGQMGTSWLFDVSPMANTSASKWLKNMFGIKKLTRLVETLREIQTAQNLGLRADIQVLARDIERNQKSVVNAFTMLRKPTAVQLESMPQEYRDHNGIWWQWSLDGWRMHPHRPAMVPETRNQNVAQGIP